jgi:hypothetical protein
VNLSYYIVAGLPALQPQEPPKISYIEFMETVRRILDEKDLHVLEKARLSNAAVESTGNPVLTAFQLWENDLRNRMAAQRPAARHSGERSDARPGTPSVESLRTARAAVEAADPLQGEMVQNRARWDLLTSLETGHQFDIEYLIIYALKLQILERTVAMSPTNGAEAFQYLEEDFHRALLEKMVEAEGGIMEP